MMELPVSGKYIVLVDDDDFAYLREFVWYTTGSKQKWETYIYPCCQVRKGTKELTILLHRLVMGCMPGDKRIVDHINGNTFDARKQNLRFCTHGQNICNQRKHKLTKTSQYNGVHFATDRNMWRAQIRINNAQIRLGQFSREIDAALAYDAAAIKLHGEFASLNFPKS